MSRKDIQESKARIDVYSSSYKPDPNNREGGSGPIVSIDIPFAMLVSKPTPGPSSLPTSPADPVKLEENSKAMYWSALCINGRTTLNDLHAINQLTHSKPDV